MKIVMTNTADHTRKVITFNDFCRRYFGFNCGRTMRIFANCRLLDNKVFTDREYEFKRERLVKDKEVNHDKTKS